MENVLLHMLKVFRIILNWSTATCEKAGGRSDTK